MGRETKVGLAVIGLLLAVFGLVVYLKVYRWQPEAAPDVLAQGTADAPENEKSSSSPEGRPTVQLPTEADEVAPIAVPSPESPFGTDADRDSGASTAESVAGGQDPDDWSASPTSNRRRQVGAAEEEPVVTQLADEVQPPKQLGIGDATDAGGSAQDRFGTLDDREGHVASADEMRQIDAPAVADPGLNEQADTTQYAESVAEPDQQQTAELAADPAAGLERSDATDQPPHPAAIPYGETVQAAAEEPLAEPPAELAPSSRGDLRRPPQAGDRRTAIATPIAESNPEENRNPLPSSAAPTNFQRPDDSYTVEPNDNFWKISQKLYGTGAYFKALFEHNRQQYPRADRLRHGDVVSAPPVEVLERTYPDLCPRPQHRLVEAKVTRAVSGRRMPRGGQVYVVEEGDTLFDIARYTLGQASRWGEIYDLNRDVLGDQVDHLKPGMELVLPANGPQESVAREPASGLR